MRSPRTENNRRIHFEVRRGRKTSDDKGRPTYKCAGDKFDLYKRAGDKFDLSKRAGDEFNF